MEAPDFVFDMLAKNGQRLTISVKAEDEVCYQAEIIAILDGCQAHIVSEENFYDRLTTFARDLTAMIDNIKGSASIGFFGDIKLGVVVNNRGAFDWQVDIGSYCRSWNLIARFENDATYLTSVRKALTKYLLTTAS